MMKENEIIIGKLFKEVFPIEWMRYNMFHCEDIYFRIPNLLYRYEEGYDETCEIELGKCLKEFKGKQKWVTYHPSYCHNQNYILTIKVAYEKFIECEKNGISYNEKEEFGSEYKKLCDEAIEDIPYLEEHIRNWMNKNLPEMRQIAMRYAESKKKRKR